MEPHRLGPTHPEPQRSGHHTAHTQNLIDSGLCLQRLEDKDLHVKTHSNQGPKGKSLDFLLHATRITLIVRLFNIAVS